MRRITSSGRRGRGAGGARRRLEWNVEEDGVDFVLIILGQFNPVLALLRRKVGGVHIVHGALGDEPRLSMGADWKIRGLEALFADVIEQQARTMSLESGTMLWRLNQETLTGAGRPIARTTTPLGGRGAAAGLVKAWKRRRCVAGLAPDLLVLSRRLRRRFRRPRHRRAELESILLRPREQRPEQRPVRGHGRHVHGHHDGGGCVRLGRSCR